MRRATIVNTLWRTVIFSGCVTAVGAALAQDANGQAGILWKCMQETDKDFHIRCIPLPIPSGSTDSSIVPFRNPAAGLAVPVAERSGIPLWRGRDLRPVAMRGHEEVFSAEAWRMPLFARPADPTAVTRLLESVLCGETPRCRVSYGAGGVWPAAWQ
jgi:hypothetical protein